MKCEVCGTNYDRAYGVCPKCGRVPGVPMVENKKLLQQLAASSPVRPPPVVPAKPTPVKPAPVRQENLEAAKTGSGIRIAALLLAIVLAVVMVFCKWFRLDLILTDAEGSLLGITFRLLGIMAGIGESSRAGIAWFVVFVLLVLDTVMIASVQALVRFAVACGKGRPNAAKLALGKAGCSRCLRLSITSVALLLLVMLVMNTQGGLGRYLDDLLTLTAAPYFTGAGALVLRYGLVNKLSTV